MDVGFPKPKPDFSVHQNAAAFGDLKGMRVYKHGVSLAIVAVFLRTERHRLDGERRRGLPSPAIPPLRAGRSCSRPIIALRCRGQGRASPSS